MKSWFVSSLLLLCAGLAQAASPREGFVCLKEGDLPCARRIVDELTEEGDRSAEAELLAGRVLFHEGDLGDRFYIVIEGELEIIKALGTSSEFVLDARGPGEFVGEMSLLDHGPRTATVVCETNCVLLLLDQRHFMGVLDEVPTLAHKLLAALAARIRDLDRQHYG